MENKINTKPWLKHTGKMYTFNRNLIKIGLPYLLSSKRKEWHTQWMILKDLFTPSEPDIEGVMSERAIFIDRDGQETWLDADKFADGLYKIEQSIVDKEQQFDAVVSIEERAVFNKEFFEKFTEVPYMIWQYDDSGQWLKQVAYIMPSLVKDTTLIMSVPRAMETSLTSGITSSKWQSVQITLNNPDHLQIVKLTDVMTDIPEKYNNVIVVGPTKEGENLI